MRDGVGKRVAIFKCIDEEPFAPNNPKGYINSFGSDSFRPGIKSGEVSLREAAAYYLDEQKIHGVPHTTLVELQHPHFSGAFDYHPSFKKGFFQHKFLKMMKKLRRKGVKVGSLQKIVSHQGCSEDISSSLFSTYEV